MSRHAAPCHSASLCASGGQLNWPCLRWPLHHLRCLLLPLRNPFTPLSTSCVENINMCMFRRSACDMCYLNTETKSYKRFWDHFYIVSLTNNFLFITCLCIKKKYQIKFFSYKHHIWQFLWGWDTWCLYEHHDISGLSR